MNQQNDLSLNLVRISVKPVKFLPASEKQQLWFDF
jgi:hypothetical protein